MTKLDYDIHNFCIVCHIVYLKPELKCVDINGCGKKIRTKPSGYALAKKEFTGHGV